jgi:hypothetical protein
MSVAITPPFLFTDQITHFGLVTVGRDEKACVHLFAPTYHQCWRSILLATRLLAE